MNAEAESTGTGTSESALWGLEYARLSVFFGERAPQAGLWQQIVGEAPAKTERQPQPPVVREQGGVGGLIYDLQSHPHRADWTLLPTPSPNWSGSGRLIHLPLTHHEVDERLSRTLDVFGRELGLLNRLAYAALVSHALPSATAGLKLVPEAVRSAEMNRHEGLDWQHRINKAGPSTNFPDVRVNRLETWSFRGIP